MTLAAGVEGNVEIVKVALVLIFPVLFPFAIRVVEGNAEIRTVNPFSLNITCGDAQYTRLGALRRLATHPGPGKHVS